MSARTAARAWTRKCLGSSTATTVSVPPVTPVSSVFTHSLQCMLGGGGGGGGGGGRLCYQYNCLSFRMSIKNSLNFTDSVHSVRVCGRGRGWGWAAVSVQLCIG